MEDPTRDFSTTSDDASEFHSLWGLDLCRTVSVVVRCFGTDFAEDSQHTHTHTHTHTYMHFLHAEALNPIARRVHVLVWYVLWRSCSAYLNTLGPKYKLLGCMDPLDPLDPKP